MKTLTKTTIRNASKKKLLDFISYLDDDYPEDLPIAELRRKARECERRSHKWFGGHVSFEDWANS